MLMEGRPTRSIELQNDGQDVPKPVQAAPFTQNITDKKIGKLQ